MQVTLRLLFAVFKLGMGSSNVDITSEDVFQREQKFGAHNYHPLPVALCKAQGRLTLRRHLAYSTTLLPASTPLKDG